MLFPTSDEKPLMEGLFLRLITKPKHWPRDHSSGYLLSVLPSCSCTTFSRPAFTDLIRFVTRLNWASHLFLLERKSCRLGTTLSCHADPWLSCRCGTCTCKLHTQTPSIMMCLVWSFKSVLLVSMPTGLPSVFSTALIIVIYGILQLVNRTVSIGYHQNVLSLQIELHTPYTAQYTYRSSPCEVQRDLCSIGRLQGLGLLKSLAAHNVTSTPPCNDFLPSMYRPELRLHGQVSMELKAQLEHSN